MMTIEQRLEQLERQNQRIERKNRRLSAALTLTVVAMCAVVTVAATGEKHGEFDTVVADSMSARNIIVRNDADMIAVSLGATDGGNGLVRTESAKGKELVKLTSNDNGGIIDVFNKTGEGIAQMHANEYGNGVVWAGNRKGMGRELKPGP